MRVCCIVFSACSSVEVYIVNDNNVLLLQVPDSLLVFLLCCDIIVVYSPVPGTYVCCFRGLCAQFHEEGGQ